MLLRHAALHQWFATALEPVRNEQTVICLVFVFELFASLRQKQNRPWAETLEHLGVLQKANH